MKKKDFRKVRQHGLEKIIDVLGVDRIAQRNLSKQHKKLFKDYVEKDRAFRQASEENNRWQRDIDTLLRNIADKDVEIAQLRKARQIHGEGAYRLISGQLFDIINKTLLQGYGIEEAKKELEPVLNLIREACSIKGAVISRTEPAVRSAVMVAIGEASIAWVERPTSEFDSRKAEEIGERLVKELFEIPTDDPAIEDPNKTSGGCNRFPLGGIQHNAGCSDSSNVDLKGCR